MMSKRNHIISIVVISSILLGIGIVYGITTGKDHHQLVSDLPKESDRLNVTEGKFILAFSNIRSQSENGGILATIDEKGNYVSQTQPMSMQSPIGPISNNRYAYFSNNASLDRYMIDLKSGEISSTIVKNNNESNSLFVYADNNYSMYDVTQDEKHAQKVIWWEINHPKNKHVIKVPAKGLIIDAIVVNNRAYFLSTSDCNVYVTSYDLKNNKVKKQVQLAWGTKENISTAGEISNSHIEENNGKLYVTFHRTYGKAKGGLWIVNTSQLKLEKTIYVPDQDFQPNTLLKNGSQLKLLGGNSKEIEMYSITKTDEFKKDPIEIEKGDQQKKDLKHYHAFLTEVRLKGDRIYALMMYELNGNKQINRAEILGIRWKDGKQISRTIVKRPDSKYDFLSFGVMR